MRLRHHDFTVVVWGDLHARINASEARIMDEVWDRMSCEKAHDDLPKYSEDDILDR
jgi:hypothetical protein